jgi:hypothetical protein
VTEQERTDRETLLKRAVALAGAAYIAPVLTSSAAAEPTACAGQSCAPGKKGRRKCRKKGGQECNCIDGTCQTFGCPNTRCEAACVDYVEACMSGNCGCFCNGKRGWNPGICIDLLDGLCDTFEQIGTCPNGEDSECPPGTACFVTRGCENFGYPPLCGPCCPNNKTPVPAPRATGGPMIGWL